MKQNGGESDQDSSRQEFPDPSGSCQCGSGICDFAMEDPKPNFMLLDRFLIMMEQAGIPAIICFNKKDLAEKETQEALSDISELWISGDFFTVH